MKYKPYRYLLYLGLRLIQGWVNALPRDLLLLIANGLGRAAFLIARRERKKTLLHLSWVYGEEKNPKELWELGERVFIHFAQAAIDVLRFPQWNRDALDHLIDKGEGFSVINKVLSRGQGAILLTAHLGNWELLGAFLKLSGYDGAGVGRRIYYEKFNQFLVDLRKQVGVRTIYQDAPAREYLKVLNQNRILVILADQDVDRLDGIFVPFFGRPAYTLTAPVKLALATGAPLLPAFLLRKGLRYQLLVEEPIEVEMRGSRDETIHEYTARWSQVIEEKIRAFPDQWVWMHRRWKTQNGHSDPPQYSGGEESQILRPLVGDARAQDDGRSL